MAYSGYRGEETPRAFTRDQEKVEITEILSRWVEEGFEERERRRFFLCKGSDGGIHKIFYDEKTAKWYPSSTVIGIFSLKIKLSY